MSDSKIHHRKGRASTWEQDLLNVIVNLNPLYQVDLVQLSVAKDRIRQSYDLFTAETKNKNLLVGPQELYTHTHTSIDCETVCIVTTKPLLPLCFQHPGISGPGCGWLNSISTVDMHYLILISSAFTD